MDAGTFFWILLIGGGVIAMLFMHRGGHAHGRAGRGGCGGHGHDDGRTSGDEPRESPKEGAAPVGKPGSHCHGHEPAAGGKHRGC